MSLDLDELRARHPVLSAARAHDLSENAAFALQRRHVAGVALSIVAHENMSSMPLVWRRRETEPVHLDAVRVTEDGAEAIALALVHELEGWTIHRRLPRGEHADWLLKRDGTGVRMALEVSGTDEGPTEARLREKLRQVARASSAFKRVACVIRFTEPQALLAQVPE